MLIILIREGKQYFKNKNKIFTIIFVLLNRNNYWKYRKLLEKIIIGLVIRLRCWRILGKLIRCCRVLMTIKIFKSTDIWIKGILRINSIKDIKVLKLNPIFCMN